MKYLVVIILVFCMACTPKKARPSGSSDYDFNNPPSLGQLSSGEVVPPTPEEAKEQLGQMGHDWFYGSGLGKTAANVAASIAFPPYIIYLVGNAGLSLAGYEPLYVTNLLPEKERHAVDVVYESVTSMPGLITSRVAGKEFVTPEALK